MGQDVSKAITPPLLTLHDCIVEDQIDIRWYLYYRRSSNHFTEVDDLTSTCRSKNKEAVAVKV